MSFVRVALAIGAFVTWVMAQGCSNCASACTTATSTILHTNGFTIVAATSSCQNVHSALPGHDLIATALGPAGGDCVFQITLDDGETVSLDVPFTQDAKQCCCGDCSTVKAADFATMTIDAPAGYVPDAGGD